MNLPLPFSPTLAAGLGMPEFTLIFLVFLVLFGAKRLPELARAAGKSIHEFKKATSEVEDTFRSAIAEEERKKIVDTRKQPTSEV